MKKHEIVLVRAHSIRLLCAVVLSPPPPPALYIEVVVVVSINMIYRRNHAAGQLSADAVLLICMFAVCSTHSSTTAVICLLTTHMNTRMRERGKKGANFGQVVLVRPVLKVQSTPHFHIEVLGEHNHHHHFNGQ